jgi:hypothetical protein
MIGTAKEEGAPAATSRVPASLCMGALSLVSFYSLRNAMRLSKGKSQCFLMLMDCHPKGYPQSYFRLVACCGKSFVFDGFCVANATIKSIE